MKQRTAERLEIERLVLRAQQGDREAFTALVRRYERMTHACAYAVLGDFHLAQDAAQDAFIAAYSGLASLREPAAFPGWLRGITRYQALRLRPDRKAIDRALPDTDLIFDIGSGDWDRLHDTACAVQAAIGRLPEELREITLLFYLHEYTQREIAAFVQAPVTTVNNRLHAARAQLKRRLFAMVSDTLNENRPSHDFAERVGRILAVHGPLADVRPAIGAAPEVLTTFGPASGVGAPAADTQPTLTVVQRRNDGNLRCIDTRDGNGRTAEGGMAVTPTAGVLPAALTDSDLAAVVRELRAATPASTGADIVETGIKAIDLFCPIRRGAVVGLFGGLGLGAAVLIGELAQRLCAADTAAPVTVAFLVRRIDISAAQDAARSDTEFLGQTDQNGALQTVWLPTERATDPWYATKEAASLFDSVLCLSPVPAAEGLWPAIDGLCCSSRLLREDGASTAHRRMVEAVHATLARAKQLTADPVFLELLACRANRRAAERIAEYLPQRLTELNAEDRRVVERARKLQRFLIQPFFTAEPYTGNPGVTVPLAETLRGCAAILDGDYDDVPEERFLRIGKIDEAQQ